MNATFCRHRSGRAAQASFCAWAILVFAGYLLAVSSARAQSSTPTTTLQGGVQQNSTTGDVFNGSDAGPTNTNQPGVGGPACDQIDPECGGTNRQCYNAAYHSTGIVMSVAKSQSLYQQTQGQIWIRCGACGSNVICWPRPAFQDLIAGRASGGGPGPGQSGVPGGQGGPPLGGAGRAPMPGPAGGIGYVPGPDPCKPKGPGGYDYCANGPGARLPPGCFCGGGPDPTLAGYVDSNGETPAGDSSPEGNQAPGASGKDPGTPGSPSKNAGPAPRLIPRSPQAVPLVAPVLRSPSTGGGSAAGGGAVPGGSPVPGGGPVPGGSPVTGGGPVPGGSPVTGGSPGSPGAGGGAGAPSRIAPLKGGTVVFVNGTQQTTCHFDPAKPYYNYHDKFTIDLSQHGILDVNRRMKSVTGNGTQSGTIKPNCDSSGMILSLTLRTGGETYTLTPSNIHGVFGF